jgi:hypothetical protein
MSLQDEIEAELRPNSQDSPAEEKQTNNDEKNRKSYSKKNSDRIMIFKKEK